MHPDIQAKVAEYYGATPSLVTACNILRTDIGSDADSLYHCGDDKFLHSIYLWKTPVPDCGNGSSDCMDYNTWTQKWFEVRGS